MVVKVLKKSCLPAGCFLLIFLMMISFFASSCKYIFAAESSVSGDINDNGEVDILDAYQAKRAAMKMITLKGNAFIAADLDHDGIISIIEARKIKRAAMKEIDLNEDPAHVDIISLTQISPDSVKITWTDHLSCTGYQLRVSALEDFSDELQIYEYGQNIAETIISDLKENQTYWFSVRLFNTIQGTNHYSEWSAGQKIQMALCEPKVELQTVNETLGWFQIRINNIYSDDDPVTDVKLAVWSEENMADLIWTSLHQEDEHTYSATIDLHQNVALNRLYTFEPYICFQSGEREILDRFSRRVTISKNAANISFQKDDSGKIMSCYLKDVPYYNQCDSRWSSKVYGNGTMKNSACGVCVLNSIVNYFTDTENDPTQLADLLYVQKYYNAPEVLGTQSTAVRFIAERYHLQYENNLTQEQLINALKMGKMIFCSVNPGTFTVAGSTHALLLYGCTSDKRTNVYDPYNQSKNGLYPITQIWDEQSTAWEDCLDDGPFFSLGASDVVYPLD